MIYPSSIQHLAEECPHDLLITSMYMIVSIQHIPFSSKILDAALGNLEFAFHRFIAET